MSQPDPDYISSDCPIAARAILQGVEEGDNKGHARKVHPLTLLRMAYGLAGDGESTSE
jgi:glycerol-3-phosphate dehydrogenase subunit C